MVGAAWSLRGPGTAHISHRFSRGARAETGREPAPARGQRGPARRDAPTGCRRVHSLAGECPRRGPSQALLPRPLGRPRDGPGESAARLRQILFVKRAPAHVPAHVRPVLRLVVAARRRRLRARRLQGRPAAACAASPADMPAGQLPAARTCPTTARRCSSPTASSIPHVRRRAEQGRQGQRARGRLLPRLRDERRRHRPAPAHPRASTTTSTPATCPAATSCSSRRARALSLQCSQASADATAHGRPARQLRPLRRRQLPAGARLHAARDGRRRRQPAADLGLRELRVDARRWPTTAASSTPAGTTSTASTATSSASGRPTRTAPTRSSSTATTPCGRRCSSRRAPIPGSHEARLHRRRAPLDHAAARSCLLDRTRGTEGDAPHRRA